MDKSALSRATDSSAAPTPGYLYNDIAKTLNSPQTCIDTLNYLLNRLSKNNPHVKKKSLKVLAKISASPTSRGMMKRSVVQNAAAIGAIKDAMAFRGTMDAVNGDKFNAEVRDAAKECLEVVYSDAGEMTQQMGGAGGGGQLQGGGMAGLGSGGGGGGGYGAPMGGATGTGIGSSNNNMPAPGGPAGSMQGIGNPMFADPRSAQSQGSSTVGDKLGAIGGAMLGMIKDPLAKNVPMTVPGAAGGMPGYGGPNARPDPYAAGPPGRNNLAMQTGGQWTMASNRGPNAVGSTNNAVVPNTAPAVENSEYYKTRNAQGGQGFSWAASGGGVPSPTAAAAPAAPTGVGGTWGSAPMSAPPQPPAMSAHQSAPSNVASAVPITGTAAAGGRISAPSSFSGFSSGGEYEKNLIAELCPPGGMKAEPPADKLEDFARAIPSLNPDLVCPALLDALEDGNPWIMRAKALCVIDTVLKVEAQNGGEVQAYTDFFHACSSEIEPLSNHARASVKGPAKRVLAALGVNASTSAMNGTASAPAAASEAPPADLLNFGDEPAAAVPPPPVPVEAPPAPPAGDSLFSGLNTKAAAPVAAPVVSLPIIPTAPSDDLLGNFGGPAPTEVSAVPPAPEPAASSGGDLFGNMTVKSAPIPSSEIKVETVAEPASAAPPALAGSAFGFMNNTPSSPGGISSPAAQTAAQTTPAVSSPKAFDPLLSMGTPGTNGTANAPVSPNPNMNMAQMQQMQMAYQQNMMMMQQQMQQMQMAGGYGNPGISPGANQQYQRQGSNGMPGMGGVPPMPMPGTKQPVMGANYMRQVPGVAGDTTSSFSFLGSAPKKKDNHEFDFVRDTMKKG